MPSVLSIDGRQLRFIEEDSVSLALQFPTEAALHRCRACGEELVETSHGYQADSSASLCPEAQIITDSHGSHDPAPVPLSWIRSAAVSVDATQDAMSVRVAVGNPHGVFELMVRRVPVDAPGVLAGRLLLHVPSPDPSGSHSELASVHPGTYVIG